MNKPYSESCDQNCEPILAVIQPLFAQCSAVLEIGSGTGQHAVHFAARMPHLLWHTSDREENHAGIACWLADAALRNTRGPWLLDVAATAWPELTVDAVFSANTAHIMHEPEVRCLFAGVGASLPPSGRFALYGPFNYGGRYTSASNARFDDWLHARDPASGIREFETLDALARDAGMVLRDDYAMPANNRILYWERV
ncbi:MAG: DUF938 domain-containing protein [Thiotrichales bacterium]